MAVFTFIESWYNPHRGHSRLNYRSPGVASPYYVFAALHTSEPAPAAQTAEAALLLLSSVPSYGHPTAEIPLAVLFSSSTSKSGTIANGDIQRSDTSARAIRNESGCIDSVSTKPRQPRMPLSYHAAALVRGLLPKRKVGAAHLCALPRNAARISKRRRDFSARGEHSSDAFSQGRWQKRKRRNTNEKPILQCAHQRCLRIRKHKEHQRTSQTYCEQGEEPVGHLAENEKRNQRREQWCEEVH